MIVTVKDGDGKTVRVAGNPIKFAGEAESSARYPPPLGNDQREVLTTVLQLTDLEIDTLINDGVLGAPSAKQD